MNRKNLTSLAALVAAGALLAPGALAKGGADKPAKAKGDKPAKVEHGKSDKAHGDKGKADKPKKNGVKNGNFVFKGVVATGGSATTVTVTVSGGNSRGKAFEGQTVTFDLSAAKVNVADRNGDGKTDGADVLTGDKVVVQAKLPRDAKADAGPFKARKLVDQTAPKADEDEKDDEAPAPTPVAPVTTP